MKKQEFINKAVDLGVTYGEAFWLEVIYSKDDDKVTLEDNLMLGDCIATLDTDPDETGDLIDLCEEYAFLVNQSKKEGTYNEEQDYYPQFL